MNLEIVKKALKETDNTINLTCLWFKIDDNTKIKIDSGDESDWEHPDNLQIETYYFIATFYDAVYQFQIDRDDIEKDDVNIWGLEGDSKLFASFEDVMDDYDNKQLVSLIAKRFEELEQLECV